jgi:hypothetical protein
MNGNGDKLGRIADLKELAQRCMLGEKGEWFVNRTKNALKSLNFIVV